MRTLHPAALVAAALLLAGCGGGLWISIGDDDWDGDGTAPSVSLTTAATSVTAGGTLRVVAAASDENGIDEVAFYRDDGGRWTRLGSDGRDPYEWLVPVPDDGRTVVSVFARATDGTGERGDSRVLSVPVVR